MKIKVPAIPKFVLWYLFAIVLLFFLVVMLDNARTKTRHSLSTPSEQDLTAEQTRVYRDAAKAAEEFNGRKLTSFEKEELWQFSRTEAAINEDERSRESDR